jgi:hypothetical protein
MRSQSKAQFVELIINNTTTPQFQFERQEYLEGKHICAIEAYCITDFAKSPVSLGAMVNTTTFANAFLVLSYKGRENLQLIPLSALRRAANNGVRFDCDIDNIEWSKSYVRIVSQSGQAANEAFGFMFFYNDEKPNKH